MTTPPSTETVNDYRQSLILHFNDADEFIARWIQNDIGVKKQQYERSLRLPYERRSIFEDGFAKAAEHMLGTVDELIANATADQLRNVINGMANAW